MPKKKTKKMKLAEEKKEKWYSKLKDETKYSILAVIFFVSAIFFTLASFSKAGIIGNYSYKILGLLFGAGFFLVPVVLFLITISFLISFRPNVFITTLIGGILFLLSSLGIADVVFGEKTGGYVGFFISLPLIKFFDFWVSLILLTAILIISLLIILNTSFSFKLKKKDQSFDSASVDAKALADGPEDKKDVLESVKEIMAETKEVAQKEIKLKEKEAPTLEDVGAPTPEDVGEISFKHHKIKGAADFQPPPIDFLETSKGKPSSGDVKANSNIIKRTFQNFGINVEMNEVNVGPSVTQYTLKPAEGIKLSRIIGLQNDLSLALASYPLRIEAPIPGKSLVGIEIPNTTKTLVGMADILSQEEFKNSNQPLLFALGRDTSGKALFADLAKMPHLLIAGATGTGKSIMIHNLVISLLYRNSPEMLRFLMLDPKKVELTIYNKIPHLLSPVITNAKKAIMTLKWASGEMERRYEILLKSGVRDITSYHKDVLPKLNNDEEQELMPNIIIIIDELADLMATYPREMEASIVRLAQMSRAVGLHLVVSTQRPSVEVITGLIKANITSRIALQVASQIDSRTILDMAGAEKLLGNGDMLYLAGNTSKPKRIQGPFISEKEIKNVVKYLADKYKSADLELESLEDLQKETESSSPSFDEQDFDKDDDELYEEARELVIKTGKASSSYLQRRFKIGYARSARILDMLEERRVVGPGEGAKPREVLIKESDQDQPPENEVMF